MLGELENFFQYSDFFLGIKFPDFTASFPWLEKFFQAHFKKMFWGQLKNFKRKEDRNNNYMLWMPLFSRKIPWIRPKSRTFWLFFQNPYPSFVFLDFRIFPFLRIETVKNFSRFSSRVFLRTFNLKKFSCLHGTFIRP